MITLPINNSDLSVYEYDLLPEFDFNILVNHINEYKEKFPKNYSKLENQWDWGTWWRSNYLVQYQTDKFNDLISNIEQKANSIVNLPSATITFEFKIKESWIIDHTKLSYHKKHAHSLIAFSAVCYMDVLNGSDIWFNSTKITPVTGKLLIFSGSLRHQVRPMLETNSRRLVMAFNLYPIFNDEKFNKYIIENA